jgi:hypothetical protein
MKGSWNITYRLVDLDSLDMQPGMVKIVHVIAESVVEAIANSPEPEKGWFHDSVTFDHWIDRVETIGPISPIQIFGGGKVRR